MPTVDLHEKNRRPPRGINLAERHVQKHLPDTPQMLKQLRKHLRMQGRTKTGINTDEV